MLLLRCLCPDPRRQHHFSAASASSCSALSAAPPRRPPARPAATAARRGGQQRRRRRRSPRELAQLHQSCSRGGIRSTRARLRFPGDGSGLGD
ncbi:hypothetical protein GHT09_006225 [Marmota monax]|uniref:Uncharacterized protein n=1 Tax=Marmota monax TaxID=9995 RepID=A0A834V3K7_MARMO|nr:hypothetical protein GHT09_006225 [Marmota monax]